MTITTHTPFKRLAKTLAVGLVALGVSGAAMPASASGGNGPRAIAERIEHIAYQVDSIPAMRSPRRQDAKIDRLQARLARLEAITEHQHGRLARRNDARIDRLQSRLHRMERRVERRIDRRDDRWEHGRDYSRDYRRDGASVVFGWRY